jgi:hypothetical protein
MAEREHRVSDSLKTEVRYQPPELLYGTTDPAEIPLVLPRWARARWPELGDWIDEGLRRRREAGL